MPLEFFQRNAETVARELIGCILVRDERRARIVETEAYVGEHDLACHASRGRTARTQVMFGPGGHLYIYLIYGIYDMLNIVTGPSDDAQAVLIRAAEPLDGWSADLSGPGKLAAGFRLSRKHNGLPLNTPHLYIAARPDPKSPKIAASPRIGVDYAGDWRHKHLRFFDANSRAVSGRRAARPPHREITPLVGIPKQAKLLSAL